ncbi:MAG: HDIG domain-containing protein [Spirochaetia bacterium]|nr:HDIG domain-containing protein [Spirochaetia bacterium]
MKKINELLRYVTNQKHKIIKIALLFSFIIDLLFIVLLSRMETFSDRSNQLQAGMVAERDIVANKDIQYIDSNAMSKLKYDTEKKIIPIFKVDSSITANVIAAFGEFSSTLQTYFSENLDYDAFFNLSEKLKADGYTISPDFLYGMGKSPAASQILETSRKALEDLMTVGVMEKTAAGYDKNQSAEVWRWRENLREKEDIALTDLMTTDKIPGFIKSRYSSFLDKNDLQTVVLFVQQFAKENLFFDYNETNKKKETLLANLDPVYKTLMQGDVIVKKGFIISDSDMEKIDALKQSSSTLDLGGIIGTVIFLSILFIMGIVIIPIVMDQNRGRKQSYMLFFLILIEIFFFLFLILVKTPPLFDNLIAALIIPSAMFSMLLSIVCSVMAGVGFAFISSLIVFLFDMNSALAAIFVVLSGLSGALVVHNYSKRIQLIRSGVHLGIINMFLMLAFVLASGHFNTHRLLMVLFAFFNGMACSILCLGILPIIEHVMNVPTQSRLAELSDLNTPILQKMLHMASGTFNHSILVGNLAEAACIDIKANGLLARVGGYYHDIGKIDQADFFIENQETYNRHDNLSPSLSVSIIKSHVKYGVEKAKELNLPPEVIDIIAHHHGNGLISYFYVEAMKLEDKARVTPEAYSYSDGRPKSKEEAVVLLADTIEAAVRAMKNPTLEGIQKRVSDIIKSKIESGQISESELTFNDLKIIENSFVNTLRGIHHSRIQYPKQEEINELSSNSK